MNKFRLSKKQIIICCIFALVFIYTLFETQQYIINSLVLIALYAYWASSWNILGGFAGQLSLGHASFVGIGAYVTTILFQYEGVSPWLGVLIAGFFAGIASLVIGIPCFKLKGSYFTLSTVAFSHVFRIIFNVNKEVLGYQTNAAQGMKLPWKGSFWDMQFLDKSGFFYITFILLILVLLLSYRIKNSKMGYYLAAINTNQDAASSLGVNVYGSKLLAMFISAFLTAIGGGVYAMLLQYIDPTTVFSYDLSVKIMILAVVGGRGTIWGPIIGALILVPLQQFLNSSLGASLAGISTAIYGVLLMLAIFFMPNGLLQFLKDFTQRRNEGHNNA